MGDPIPSTAELIVVCGAGLLALMVAWRPRQTLARIFGRRLMAAAPASIVQFNRAMAALAALAITAMLIAHFFPGVLL